MWHVVCGDLTGRVEVVEDVMFFIMTEQKSAIISHRAVFFKRSKVYRKEARMSQFLNRHVKSEGFKEDQLGTI